jgi:hypothetical protein
MLYIIQDAYTSVHFRELVNAILVIAVFIDIVISCFFVFTVNVTDKFTGLRSVVLK